MIYRVRHFWFWLLIATVYCLLSSPEIMANKDVLIIAHPSVPNDQIEIAKLNEIFLGRQSTWPDGVAVKYTINIEKETHRAFVGHYLRKSTRQYSNWIKKRLFAGKGNPAARTFKTTSEVITYISITPGAIGYISDRPVHSGVKLLEIVK